MSRNIKEIGKELMGKSLNSFHRKTGLTQLEENNKMQDGILDGILSQVDDAYIEKTEQSNVIHLDGSGDGVVVLDSIEGNTMVNLATDSSSLYIDSSKGYEDIELMRKIPIGTLCTIIFTTDVLGIYGGFLINDSTWSDKFSSAETVVGLNKILITATNEIETLRLRINGSNANIKDIMVLEGDWTNREILSHFEGLQSSFEEKVNEQGKYEIEILSNNKNLCKITEDYKLENANGLTLKYNKLGQYIEVNGTATSDLYLYNTTHNVYYDIEPLKAGTTYTCSLNIVGNVTSNSERSEIGYFSVNGNTIACRINNDKSITKIGNGEYSQYTPTWIRLNGGVTFSNCKIYLHLEKGVSISNYEPYKQNKIKLLINEPLRGINNIGDRLCIKNGKLVIERNYKSKLYDGLSCAWQIFDVGVNRQFYTYLNDVEKSIMSQNSVTSINDRYSSTYFNNRGNISARNCALMTFSGSNKTNLLCVYKSQDVTLEQFKTELNNNPMVMVYQLEEPIYEEVLNEYGEPILLEGYENGTLYIDSTIVPTTTVRYTPKMESFKTLNEVSDNNTMLTNDINDNIIPYLMDVDLMIMEKEMALMSHKNIRKMEVLDMTSMQKRTQDMLERLIKGKTLTEQECKTRITTYLNAGKITDAQAEELMLLISEVYA